MNLKNKTDKELWDMLEYFKWIIKEEGKDINDNGLAERNKHEIYREIIRRENREECTICHGEGFIVDHHDPCTECGGSGYYD